jgi:hypothetical protein
VADRPRTPRAGAGKKQVTSQPWTPGEGGSADKRIAPATMRNRDAIAAVLADWLPASGKALEVASGSGEHVVHFAAAFPGIDWQPSDPDPAGLTSIAAYRAEAGLANIAQPLSLDAAARDWPVDRVDAILCINMVHISPWEATLGLFAGAARLLAPASPLILYGPYIEADVPTADSNARFRRQPAQPQSGVGSARCGRGQGGRRRCRTGLRRTPCDAREQFDAVVPPNLTDLTG